MARTKTEQEQLVDDLVEEVQENTGLPPGAELTPCLGDPEWEDYVLSQLVPEKEMDANGHPYTAGLRRLAYKLLGPIVESGPTHVMSESGRTTVIWGITIEFHNGDGRTITYSDVSDVDKINTEPPYCNHPSATAATKAEGRALKKALLLRTTVAEELGVSKEIDEAGLKQEGNITSAQIAAIDQLCKKVNVDAAKLTSWGGKYPDIYKIPRDFASDKIISRLNQYQRGEKEVEDSIKGYQENWRA